MEASSPVTNSLIDGTDRTGPSDPAGRSKPGPRRERLRMSTAAAHSELDERLVASGCFDSVTGYGRYLAAIAPLYDCLETALDMSGVARLLPDWGTRRKAALMAADLEVLGLCPAAATSLADPHLHRGDMLGILYVLEGATLGGALLARRLQPLGIVPDRGGTFLDPYGDNRGMMWRCFLSLLEAAQLSASEDAALCPRAQRTFDMFQDAADRLLQAAQ